MKQRISLLTILTLALAVTGCGDNIGAVFRDAVTYQNELADAMLLVSDEESAEIIKNTRVARLENYWKSIEDRGKKIMKGDDKKELYIAGAHFVNQIDNYAETQIRLQQTALRLEELRFQMVLRECKKLRAEGKMATSFDKDILATMDARARSVIRALPNVSGIIDAEMQRLAQDNLNPPYEMVVIENAGGLTRPSPVFVDTATYKNYRQRKATLEEAVRLPSAVSNSGGVQVTALGAAPNITRLIGLSKTFNINSAWSENPYTSGQSNNIGGIPGEPGDPGGPVGP